ncbi:hypothetical protein QEZ52_11000 [Aliisedimentitalea scapharcae]|uniref:Uncharacterized protein n=1 Tax=Aliisedimentitalea scapharcae TaxID=1524259 RepID=A0ABZ2XPB2_9RHOB
MDDPRAMHTYHHQLMRRDAKANALLLASEHIKASITLPFTGASVFE